MILTVRNIAIISVAVVLFLFVFAPLTTANPMIDTPQSNVITIIGITLVVIAVTGLVYFIYFSEASKQKLKAFFVDFVFWFIPPILLGTIYVADTTTWLFLAGAVSWLFAYPVFIVVLWSKVDEAKGEK